MKGDLYVIYNLKKHGWYGKQGELMNSYEDAMLYKYAPACELVELANADCDPDSVPVALMARA